MKGLLLKDLYMMKKQFIIYLIIFISFTLSLFSLHNTYFLVLPCFMISIIPNTVYIYDESERFSAYSATLPISRKQYISEKYIIGMICNCIVIAAASVVYYIYYIKMTPADLYSIVDYLSFIAIIFSIIFISPSLSFPILTKFGGEKGRIIYCAVCGALFALFMIFQNIGENQNSSLNSHFTQGTISALLAIIAIFAYWLSWVISVRIFEKKEL